MSAIEPQSFPWLDYKKYSFSLGLKTPAGTFLSGNTASEYDTATKHVVVRGGMAQQVRTAWAKIEATLEAAGLSLSDVTRVVEYLPPEGIERYAEVEATRQDILGLHKPCVNTVPIRQLLRPGALIEIEVTAGTNDADISSGLIYLPTVLPLNEKGEIVAPGDVIGQTEQIFKNAQKMLADMGTDLSHVVMTLDFLTAPARAKYKASGDVRKEYLGPVYPGAAGIMQPRLMHPDALVQYDFTVSRDKVERIDPGWERYNSLSYSAGVKAGRLVFPSGMGALDPVELTFLFEGDVVAQADYVYTNIGKVFECAGGSIKDVVKTVEFITEASIPDYRGIAAVREKHFGKPYPAATGVCCGALLKKELNIEIVSFGILGSN